MIYVILFALMFIGMGVSVIYFFSSQKGQGLKS